jgi:hypothetical protein
MTFTADGRQLPVLSSSLWLGGASFDPATITNRIGVEPTISRRVGDPASLGRTQKRDAWGVRVGPRESLDLEPLIRELMEQLTPYTTRIRETCVEFGLKPCISCPIEPKSTLVPSIHLMPDTLAWMVSLGAPLDIDVMVWDDDE